MLGVIIEKTSRFIKCPECESVESFDVTDVESSETFGPWVCNFCGTVIQGFAHSNKTFEIKAKLKHAVPSLVLLKVAPQKSPLFFVLNRRVSREFLAAAQNSPNEMEFIHSPQFFFNYECDPSAYLADTIKVIKNGEQEPRGVFEFLTITERESNLEELDTNTVIDKQFSEFMNASN